MISDLSTSGCVVAIRAGYRAGSRLRIDVPGVGPVDAIVVAREGGRLRCRFIDPLDDAALTRAAIADARSGRDDEERWPRPVRAAIAVGGAAALWAAIACALF